MPQESKEEEEEGVKKKAEKHVIFQAAYFSKEPWIGWPDCIMVCDYDTTTAFDDDGV